MHFRPQSSVPVRSLIAVALLPLAGCKSTTYVLQVDAINQTGPVAQAAEPKSYRVRSHNPNVADDSLRYNEVSAYIKTALSGKGLYEAPTAESADLIIDIDFGMENPRMKYQTVVKPVIVMSVSQPKPQTGKGLFVPINGSVGQPIGKIEGFREEAEPVVVYEKYLKVSARANREVVEGRPPPEVWSVNVSAEDPSNEMRKYMPILASATADYIGQNTKQEKAVTVNEGDESVKFIKKGM